jgi:hypothetical protein
MGTKLQLRSMTRKNKKHHISKAQFVSVLNSHQVKGFVSEYVIKRKTVQSKNKAKVSRINHYLAETQVFLFQLVRMLAL